MESAPASIAPTTDAAFTLRSGHRRQAESCEKVSLTSHNAPGGAPVPSGECSRDRPVTPQHLGPFRGRLRAGRGIALWAPSMLALRRVRTAPGPYPRQIGAGEPLRDVPTLVPRVLLFVTLAEPTPLAVLARPGFVGAAPTHARHLPEQAAPSYTALLRQDGGESLSPPLKSSAPHGARGSGLSQSARIRHAPSDSSEGTRRPSRRSWSNHGGQLRLHSTSNSSRRAPGPQGARRDRHRNGVGPCRHLMLGVPAQSLGPGRRQD